MTSTASNMRLMRSARLRPVLPPTTCSLSASPEPMPSQCRPGYIAASVALAWATMAGCQRNVGTVVAGAEVARRCVSPIAPSTVQTKRRLALRGTHGWKWSVAMTPGKPCGSATR